LQSQYCKEAYNDKTNHLLIKDKSFPNYHDLGELEQLQNI